MTGLANRYANLVGSNKIKDEWQKINQGFDAVEADMDEKADADDLVSLENTVSDHIGAGGNAHAAATDQQAGFMSAQDKQKLDGVEAGAQVNQNAFAKVNDVEAADPSDELTITGGTGITISTNPNTKTVTVTATGTATPGAHGSAHTEFGADPIPLATPTEGGLMSAADKVKLDGATYAATAGTLVQRDSSGRFKAAAPSASDDVARKAETDAALAAAQAAQETADAALPASQYTAADVLAKIKTVDGTGSGLDADTVRGYYPFAGFAHGPYIPVIAGNGTPLEIGQYIDFHFPSSDSDFDGRAYIDANKDFIYAKSGAGHFKVWTAEALRWNPSGYLEYNDGGTWKPVGVFIDKSRCTPLNAYNREVALDTSYQTLLSINGKGFLDHFIIRNNNSGAGLFLRITVDGVVKFHSRVDGTGDASVLGVIKREFLLSRGTADIAGFLNPNSFDIYTTYLVEYPYTDTSGTTGKIALMAESIYFTSNLLVEVMSTSSQTAAYSYSGGYM